MDDISVRLNGDNSNYRSSMDGAVDYTGKAVSRIEEHLVGTRAVATAVGSALGLHLTEIADNVARFVLGFSKEEEDALKKLDELGQQTLDIYKRIFESRNSQDDSGEQAQSRINSLLKEQASIQDAIAVRQKAATDAVNDESLSQFQLGRIEDKAKQTAEEKTRLAEIAKELAQETAKVSDAQLADDKQSLEAVQKKVQASTEGLGDNEKLNVLYAAQKDLENQILTFKGAGKDLDILKQQHLQNEEEITKTIANEKKETQAFDLQYQTDSMKYAKDHYDILQIEAKSASQRTDLEQLELQVFQLTNKELVIRQQIEAILAIPAKERTQAEKDALVALTTQDGNLKSQIQSKAILIKAINDQAAAEAAVTGQQKEQVTQATLFLAQLEAQAKELENIADAWDNATISVTQKSDGRDNTQLTDAELQAKIDTLKSEIFNTNASQGGNQWLKDILTSAEQGQADAAQQELSKRTTFRGQVSAFGQDAALGLYSPFDQKQLQGYLGGGADTTKIVTTLSTISQQLANQGFPTGPQTVPPTG